MKVTVPKQMCEVVEARPRLRLGSRLLADAYAGDGNLLLRAGAEIDSECRLNRLLQPDVRFGPERSNKIPIDLEREAHLNNARPTNELDTAEFDKSVSRALKIKDEVIRVITEVFDRIKSLDGVEVRFAERAVSSLVNEMLEDPRALVSLTKLKDADAYTFTHSVNVSILAIYLAMHSGLIDDLELIGTAALLHDIGKMSIPLSILNKPSALTSQEQKQIMAHPQMGVDLLKKSGGFPGEIVRAVLDHHEKYCGIGYPNRRNGSSISRHARVISIADVYDALTTDRPYRKAMDPREAMLLMTGHMSKSFEPVLLKEFVAAVGYFPVGSHVKLTNGCWATVVRNHPAEPLQPAVQTIRDAQGRATRETTATDLRRKKDVYVQTFISDDAVEALRTV